MFSILPKTYLKFYITFILLSAKTFNLNQSKFLLFGKGLTCINDTASALLEFLLLVFVFCILHNVFYLVRDTDDFNSNFFFSPKKCDLDF